jgi:hypothetical protein
MAGIKQGLDHLFIRNIGSDRKSCNFFYFALGPWFIYQISTNFHFPACLFGSNVIYFVYVFSFQHRNGEVELENLIIHQKKKR